MVGFEGLYEVSDHGRVRSLDRIVTYERRDQYSGRIIRIDRRRRGQMLRPGRMGSGHLSVCLGRASGSMLVHVLVLEAFVGPKPDGREGLHWDDVPGNNRLPNLRWGTRADNLNDGIRNGKYPVGERKWNSKLKDDDVRYIRTLFDSHTFQSIADMYDVNETTIRQIKTRKTWKHVDG